jgi:hypothetical protein
MQDLLSSLITHLKENYNPSDKLLFPFLEKVAIKTPPTLEKPLPAVILLLTHYKEKEFFPFLLSLTKAIETTFAPCRIVDINEEKNFISEGLSLLMLSKPLFFQTPRFLSSYQRGAKPTLFNIPLLLLPDLTLLSKEKEEKKTLWQNLHQHLPPKVPCTLPQ